jgi:hypothetical protein
VVFGAPEWWFYGSEGEVAVVGATTDSYRLFADDSGAAIGEQAVLSPDGGVLATINRTVDLRSGTVTALPDLGGELRVPQAWSPDGRTLAVVAYHWNWTTDADLVRPGSGSTAVLSLVDVASGRAVTVAELDWRSVYDGWTVAFSRDGTRLAYQSGDIITVAELTGRARSRFTVEAGRHLAGKGAWTVDGAGLVVLDQRQCCDTDAYRSRWTLSVLDATTGTPAPNRPTFEVAGAVAVRQLGWTPAGAPVVVAYYPAPGAPTTVRFGIEQANGPWLTREDLTSNEYVRAATVLALSSAEPPRTLLTAADGMAIHLDVADEILALGLTRRGELPYWTVGHIVTVGLPALAFGLAAILVVIIAIRNARRRRKRAPGTPAAKPDAPRLSDDLHIGGSE